MRTMFGLDFGTTNSTLSLASSNGPTSVLDVDHLGSRARQVLRSTIFFDNSGRISVGEEAIEQYIADYTAGRFMRSVKTLLPSRSFTGTTVRTKTYQADDLASIIIKAIKERGEKAIGAECDAVVLGRPVVFSEDTTLDKMAEDRLLSAARKAGFKDIHLQYEPVGAALVFEHAFPSDREQNVLVGDFGGGTSDFVIMRVGGNRKVGRDRREDILSLGGVYIGGDTFDSLLMWEKMAKHFGRGIKYRSMEGRWHEMPSYIMSQLKQWHLIPQLRERKTREAIRQVRKTADDPKPIINLEHLVDDNSGIVLFRAVEQAKFILTNRTTAEIDFDDIREPVTRDEFEGIIRESCERIERCVTEVLHKARLKPHDIDKVFVTGGTSYIPYVRHMFTKTFGAPKICEQDAFTSVGYGLGLDATTFL